jgi:hypothetical protein
VLVVDIWGCFFFFFSLFFSPSYSCLFPTPHTPSHCSYAKQTSI